MVGRNEVARFFNDKSATSEKMERDRETGERNHGRTHAFGTSPLTSFALSASTFANCRSKIDCFIVYFPPGFPGSRPNASSDSKVHKGYRTLSFFRTGGPEREVNPQKDCTNFKDN